MEARPRAGDDGALKRGCDATTGVAYVRAMGHLLHVTRKPTMPTTEKFPFSIPAIRSFEKLALDVRVTFFVGENGSGKSTMLEAIACAAEIPGYGGDRLERDHSLDRQRELASHLRLAWTARSRTGFFMRAEDFFGHLKATARLDARILRERRESNDPSYRPTAEPLPDPVHVDEILAEEHLARLDVRSHGESFLEFFGQRIRGEGLYLLDEPETPLSPARQLALLALLGEKVREGAQFVIATHSPILLAYPKARILSFDKTPIETVAYESLDHVTVMRDFLNHREKYLSRLFG